MRHGSKQKKFGRVSKKRKALMQSLVHAMTQHKRITTTLAKAKALRPVIEKESKTHTRITKLPPRVSDGARMAIIEFI